MITKTRYRDGVDARLEIYQVSDDGKIVEQARSVACIVDKHFLKPAGENRSGLKCEKVDTLRDYISNSFGIPLGDDEAFGDQFAPGLGTAFLIDEQYLLTAAHCVCKKNSDELDLRLIRKARMIFDFQMKSENECNLTFETRRIEKVVAHRYRRINGKWEDWALLKMDQKVQGRTPLELDYSKVKDGQHLYMLGNPTGLPQKYISEASVQKAEKSKYFSANLDAYAGNSGSPVFDEKTGKVVGILCEGNRDYVRSADGTYVQGYVVKPKQDGYEKCQKISALKKILNGIQVSEPKSLLRKASCVLF